MLCDLIGGRADGRRIDLSNPCMGANEKCPKYISIPIYRNGQFFKENYVAAFIGEDGVAKYLHESIRQPPASPRT